MDFIKIFLTLSGFEISCLWLLTLQDRLQASLLKFAITDSQSTGLFILLAQLDLPTLNGLVWWLMLFMIKRFRLRKLQELVDLLIFNDLTSKDLQMTGLHALWD